MAKNLQQIQADVIRLAKADASNMTLMNQITIDANDAIQIIAQKRFWPELTITDAVYTTANDGDISYLLDPSVDKVDQVKIISPTNYSAVLQYIPRKLFRDIVPSKLLLGNATPSKWYFAEPLVNAGNSTTKAITFDVMPNNSYEIIYTFKSFPPLLVNLSDVPFFNPNYHSIIVPYCLMQYAIAQADPSLDPVFFMAEWENGLNSLLNNDDSDLITNAPIQADYKTVGI